MKRTKETKHTKQNFKNPNYFPYFIYNLLFSMPMKSEYSTLTDVLFKRLLFKTNVLSTSISKRRK